MENVVLVCCLAHCRRYIFKAIPAAHRMKMKLPDEHFSAEIGLRYCNKFFRVERTLKDLSAQERKEKRLELEVPVWTGFWC